VKMLHLTIRAMNATRTMMSTPQYRNDW